jgi:cytochrome b561
MRRQILPVKTHYDAVAIFLHWLTAFAIAGQLAMGWSMVVMGPGSYLKFQLYQAHKSVGITILALSVLRLGWRLLHAPPPLPASMPAWEQRLAHFNHFTLYALLLALPLSGWALVSASPLNIPTVLFGAVPLPHLPVLGTLPNKSAVEPVLKEVHEAGGWILVALLAGHIAAALRHHFLLRDDVLVRMVPRFGKQRLWA